MTEHPPACPRCGSRRVLPVVRGYPTFEAAQAIERGEAIEGGCLPGAGDWHCRDCGNEWERER